MSGSGDYISREAAVELLSQPITMSMCLSVEECHHKIAQQRIDRYLVENIPAADVRPCWIPVTERLPEKTGVYLAWMKWDLTEPEEEPSAYPIEYDAEEEAFGWWKSYYDAETFGWAGEDFIRYEGITHWMPLPEPPKEEA